MHTFHNENPSPHLFNRPLIVCWSPLVSQC